MQEKEVLRNLFLELPPRLEHIEQLLTGNGYSTECITEIFCEFANECHGEYRDFIEEHDREPLDEELHSFNMALTPIMYLERYPTKRMHYSKFTGSTSLLLQQIHSSCCWSTAEIHT